MQHITVLGSAGILPAGRVGILPTQSPARHEPVVSRPSQTLAGRLRVLPLFERSDGERLVVAISNL